MSESNTVTVSIENAVATVTLNRPHKRNAMSPMLHIEMVDVLEKLRYEKTSRVVVITGAGESFCAGMDLKQFFMDLKDDPAEFDRIYRMATEWRFRTLRYYPKPTIAMVNGYCFGGAFSIAIALAVAIGAAIGAAVPITVALSLALTLAIASVLATAHAAAQPLRPRRSPWPPRPLHPPTSPSPSPFTIAGAIAGAAMFCGCPGWINCWGTSAPAAPQACGVVCTVDANGLDTVPAVVGVIIGAAAAPGTP